jgi:hypothetical protein
MSTLKDLCSYNCYRSASEKFISLARQDVCTHEPGLVDRASVFSGRCSIAHYNVRATGVVHTSSPVLFLLQPTGKMSYSDSIGEHATFLDEEKCKRSFDERGLSPRTFKLLTICNAVFFVASLSLYASTWLHQSTTSDGHLYGPSVLNPKLRQYSSYCKLT